MELVNSASAWLQLQYQRGGGAEGIGAIISAVRRKAEAVGQLAEHKHTRPPKAASGTV
jgi:hypothetical protein